jgi:hypothetical protein
MRKLVLLGIAGIALAVGVGLAANAISRDSIGLAPTPAGSGIELSPAKTTGAGSATKAPGPVVRRKTAKPKAAPPASTGSATTRTTPPAQPAPPTTDDHGGRSRGGSGGGSGGGGSGGGSGGGHGGDD